MENARRCAAVIGERPLCDFQQRCGQIRGRRRASGLVANDPYDRARFGQPQHCPNEVAAYRAVDPRRPDDGRQGMRRKYGRLAGQL
jgi:hypothetical protein